MKGVSRTHLVMRKQLGKGCGSCLLTFDDDDGECAWSAQSQR